jgi:hypothetical protein
MRRSNLGDSNNRPNIYPRFFVNSSNRGIKKGDGGCMDAPALVCFCLAPLSQTYYIHLSSITNLFYDITYMNSRYR